MTLAEFALPQVPSLSAMRAGLHRGEPVLAAAGTFLLLCLVPTALALTLDERMLNGVAVWVKPMKFQASLGVHLLTVAALMLLLPQDVRHRRAVRWPALAMAGAALFEAGYITLRGAQGLASHYATETALAAAMYQLMGLGALVLVGGSAWLGVLVLRHGRGPAALVAGAGLGLILGGLLGLVTGGALSASGAHLVGVAASEAGGLPILGWARAGGDLRVAHFFGLHLTQSLPTVALVLLAAGRGWTQVPVYAAAGLGVAVTLGTFAQALAGRPFW
jgi:hypothetical protein